MTKQEKIGKGIYKLLIEQDCENEFQRFDWERKMPDKILKYLHSQGVVIRVDRELPENPNKAMMIDIDKYPWKTWDVAHSCGWRDGWASGRDDTIKAGYVAVEPLIEEK